MTPDQPLLSGVKLRKQFRVSAGPASQTGLLTSVDGVDLEIARGETVGIAGESGCGKSTLGKLLAGLMPPDGGEVRYCGRAVKTLPPAERERFRRRTQMIFQDPFSSLNPRMRIGDSIAEPLVIAGGGSRQTIRATMLQLLEAVGLKAEHADRFPDEFSGGQRQRIGIARALASSPEIIIADEPVSSLDISIQAQIINLLQAMKSERHLTMAIISHDLSVLRHICDRVLVMYLGVIVESAPAALLFQQYQHPYSEALIAAIPRISGHQGHTAVILAGDLPSPLAIPPGCRFHPRCRYAVERCRTVQPVLEEKRDGHFAACHLSKDIFPR
ncbi:ATP-binding cassette domain-containing protein [Geobacter sp. FeAm09]|uniref:ABC transporter ATP-binding protein n=1 Tax=Geobacter sp. FeAm09 TaxID=2597769 RepID=UPI0011ED138D|nr:oligopeptide/dipeptide ABC transporter ATP-binding protein [Geobacter sp. FeAm09]QEM68173.1 ATP-binding cassette domain-containing protein [Geobacter sp. FeAm09]